MTALAHDYISPALKRERDRRLASEEIIPGADMKREYAKWKQSRGTGQRR